MIELIELKCRAPASIFICASRAAHCEDITLAILIFLEHLCFSPSGFPRSLASPPRKLELVSSAGTATATPPGLYIARRWCDRNPTHFCPISQGIVRLWWPNPATLQRSGKYTVENHSLSKLEIPYSLRPTKNVWSLTKYKYI